MALHKQDCAADFLLAFNRAREYKTRRCWELVTISKEIMHNKYNRVADKLTAWLSASHIERTPKKKNEPAPAPKPQ